MLGMTQVGFVFGILALSLCGLVCGNPVSWPWGAVTTYGVVNPAHVTPLPNYNSSGAHVHYVLNNLPITTTSNQQLRTFTVLFYPNMDPNVVALNMSKQVTLHVARPIDGSSPTHTTRTLQYVQSITLDNVVSGQTIMVSDQHLQFQAGDLLALSVPNNAIFLRVGVNHVGLPVGYASATVPKGQSEHIFTGSFVAHPHVGSDMLQICGAFTTKQVYGNISSPPGEVCVRANGVFFGNPTQQVQHSGQVAQLSVGCGFTRDQPICIDPSCNFLWDRLNNSVVPLGTDISIRIKIWRGGDLSIPTTGAFVPGVDVHITAHCGQPTDITPIPVQQHDYVLFSVEASSAPSLDPCIPFSSVDSTLYIVAVSDTGALIAEGSEPGFTFAWQFSFMEQANIQGDPQFAGFQGQSFQFHGMPDEVFNLISSPQLQLHSHFVYLAHGTCDYNDTLCFQHPGTYLDVLGFTIPTNKPELPHAHIQVVAGSHKAGLRVWTDMDMDMDDEEDEDEEEKEEDKAMNNNTTETKTATMKEIRLGQQITWIIDNTTHAKATLRYHKHGRVTVETRTFRIEVTNSAYFLNLGVSLLDGVLLRSGHPRHTITDHATCEHDKHGHANVQHAQHEHGVVETQLRKKYHVDYPVHGLIGQTWRNALVCGKSWMGSVQDYVVSDLFGSDYYYNFYQQDMTQAAHT